MRKLVQHSRDHPLQACKLRGTRTWSQARLRHKAVTFLDGEQEGGVLRLASDQSSCYDQQPALQIPFPVYSPSEPIPKDMKGRKHSTWRGLLMGGLLGSLWLHQKCQPKAQTQSTLSARLSGAGCGRQGTEMQATLPSPFAAAIRSWDRAQ